jgi:putative spermidine/putrescine transport system permease protein
LGPAVGGRLPLKYWMFLAPAAIFLALFHLVPVADVLSISVTEPKIGLQNYERLLSSGAVQRALSTTFKIALITTVLTVALGLIYATAAQRARPSVGRAMLAAIAASFWLSVLIRTVAWVALLRDNGIVNTTLIAFGLIASPLPLLRNETGVIIGMVHYMLPLAVFPIYNSLRAIPERQRQAAQSMGAGPVLIFRSVILPQCKPGLIAASALVFMLSLGFFVTPSILGGGKVVMVAEYIKLQIDETVRWGLATMMAATLLVLVLASLTVTARAIGLGRILEGR